MKKKFLIETFGCRVNQYESQLLREQLQEIGWQEADEGVDLCVIHSCSVTASAEKSCKNRLRALCKKHRSARIVVFGCFAKRDPLALQAIDPRVEVMVETQREKILFFLTKKQDICCEKNFITHFQGHTRAFVKVQDGCSAACSYCIIPQLRGPSSSRTIEEILREIEELVAGGYQEIVLTGVNIGEYAFGLSKLIQAIDIHTKVKRLRLSSIEPNHLSDHLIKTLIEGRATMPHLHLVLQSASNAILKKMRRPYTREIFLKKVEEMRAHKSHFSFTTDLIVGFPSETQEDFLQTVDFVEKVGFVKVHIFPYSKRPNTAAEKMPGHLPGKEVVRRKKELFAVAEDASFREREKFVGQEVELLLENGGLMGYSPQFIPVRMQVPGVANQIVQVKILENQKEGLLGRKK